MNPTKMNAKKYFSSIGRLLLAGTILGLNVRSHSELKPTRPSEKNEFIEYIQQDNLINIDFLGDTSVKFLEKYDVWVSGKYKNLVSQIYEVNKKFPSTIDENLIIATIHEESSFNPKNKSYVGALGLMQVMKPTWKDYSKKKFEKYSFIPSYNVNVGTRHLFLVEDSLSSRCPNWPKLSEKEKIEMISASYNGGQNLLEHYNWDLNKMPEESRKHGIKVWNRYKQYQKQEMKEEYFSVVKDYFQKNNSSFKKLNNKTLEEILKFHLKLKKLSKEI